MGTGIGVGLGKGLSWILSFLHFVFWGDVVVAMLLMLHKGKYRTSGNASQVWSSVLIRVCVQASGESPPGVLYGHGVVAVGASLVVFGGWDGRNATNNTYILDCASLFQES